MYIIYILIDKLLFFFYTKKVVNMYLNIKAIFYNIKNKMAYWSLKISLLQAWIAIVLVVFFNKVKDYSYLYEKKLFLWYRE